MLDTPSQIPQRAVLMLIILTALLSGQNDQDAVRPFVGLGGPGGRASGLAQAFTGIADDATALYYNPAGLAHLVKTEISLGFHYLGVSTEVSPAGTSSPATITATRLGNVGLALPVAHTKLTVAAAYHLLRSFEHQRELNSARSRFRITEEGSIAAVALGAGYQVSSKLALGAALEVFTGHNKYTENSAFFTGSVQDSTDFVRIEPSYSGVGLNLGVLLAPVPRWRVGLLVRSPQKVAIKEEFSATGISPDNYNYESLASYSLRLGSSLTAGPLIFSGDMIWFDYSQIRFKSNLVDLIDSAEVPIDIGINDTLRNQYASTVGYAVGGELLVPFMNLKLRAGYRRDPPIMRESFPRMIQQTVALGMSVVPVPQIKIDLAVNFTVWQRKLNDGSSELTTAAPGWLSFAYRL